MEPAILSTSAGETLVVLDGGHHAGGRLLSIFTAAAPDLGHRLEHARKAGPPVTVLRRKIAPAVVGAPIGSEESREWPSPLPADRRNRRLVARVHVGALVAVHLHGHKLPVDERRDLFIFIRLAVHHMAPVAPHRPDVEQHRLVFSLGAGKGLLAPGVPVHWLMLRRAQVG